MSVELNVFVRGVDLQQVVDALRAEPFGLSLTSDRFTKYPVEVSIKRYAGAYSEHREALCVTLSNIVFEHFATMGVEYEQARPRTPCRWMKIGA